MKNLIYLGVKFCNPQEGFLGNGGFCLIPRENRGREGTRDLEIFRSLPETFLRRVPLLASITI